MPQAGGVAIIRLSGSSAVAAVRRIFRPASAGARRAALLGEPLQSHLAGFRV